LKKETEQVQNENVDFNADIVENATSIEVPLFQKKELNLIKDEKDEVILYNVAEKLVLNKLDATLKKMNCCRCDRCKEDIVAISLNNLKPMYIVAPKNEIMQKITDVQDLGSEVTTEVIKAVLVVRKNPRH